MMARLQLGRARLMCWVATLVVLSACAAAASPPPDLFAYDFTGMMGPYRIGAELVVRDNRTLTNGHYFYATTLTDIPLTGTVDGDAVTLTEPGGGTFRLHLFGNGSNGSAPLTFQTSVRLKGDWAEDGKDLPVKLDLSGGFNGGPPARRYQQVTVDSDAAFETRVQAFVRDVLNGDKAAAAAGVYYPLRVNGTPKLMIHSTGELLARWNETFGPKFLAALRETMPHDMFVHNGEAMLGRGLVWFDAKGVTAINEP